MIITIDRRWKKEKYTIGNVLVDGQNFGCNSLEDTDRGLDDSMSVSEIANKKIYGETAIPRGKYLVTYTYSNRFKQNLPLVNNVKGFEGIRIHSGNIPKDTLGCILIGKNTEVGKVANSRFWTNKLIEIMKSQWDKGNKVYIVIK